MTYWLSKIYTRIEWFIAILILVLTSMMFIKSISIKGDITCVSLYILFVVISLLGLYFLKTKIQDNAIKDRSQLLYILGVGLFLRLTIMILMPLEQRGDLAVYLSTGLKLYNGEAISKAYYGVFPHAIHYPRFLSMVTQPIGYHRWFIKGIHLLASSLEMLVIYGIIKQNISKKWYYFVSLSIILNPLLVFQVLFTSAEAFYSLLILLTLWLITKSFDTRSNINGKIIIYSVSIGMILAVADFFRPTGIIMLIAYIIVVMIKQCFSMKQKILAIVLTVIFFVMMTKTVNMVMLDSLDISKPDNSFGWNLYVGSNYESKGKWNQADADVFAEQMSALGDPSSIQTYFYKEGLNRYKTMVSEGKLLKHFTNKLYVWVNEEYYGSSIANWQVSNRLHITGDGISLVFSSISAAAFIVCLLLVIVKKYSKEKSITLSVMGVYMIGIIMLLMILEVNNRYKMGYYSIIIVFATIGVAKLDHVSLLNKVRQLLKV